VLSPEKKAWPNRANVLLLCAIMHFLLIGTGHAQILEAEPDPADEVRYFGPAIGMSLTGSVGLVTVPIPNFQTEQRVGVSYKGGIQKGNMTLGGVNYSTEKDERFVSAIFHAQPNLELSLNHLRIKRISNPGLVGLNFHEDATAFGMKYSSPHGKQDFAAGFHYAPMSAEELNRADLGQIELLRNAYMTFSEELGRNFYGHLHLKLCMTADQKIQLPNGSEYKIEKKEFLVSAVGLEYRVSDSFTAMIEGTFANYRDLFRDDSTRFNLNGGLRFGAGNMQLEVLGRSLESDPWVVGGVSLGF
jgi:hypothetical protein